MAIELTLVAPGGIRTALQHLLPGYEKATGNKVTGSYVSGGATKQKIIEGELFDVPVIQPPYDAVLASGNLDAKSETPLATVSVVAAQSGWESVKMLGRGEVELGITFASENDPNPDVQMLGALPRDVSIPTGFVGFIHARTAHREAAAALLKYLSTADAAKIFTECGMTPGT